MGAKRSADIPRSTHNLTIRGSAKLDSDAIILSVLMIPCASRADSV
jgi:hypothetical protein